MASRGSSLSSGLRPYSVAPLTRRPSRAKEAAVYVAWPTAAQPSPGQASETIAGCVVGALLGFVAWMVVLSLPGVWRYPNASFTLGIGAVVIAAFLGAARGGFARRT